MKKSKFNEEQIVRILKEVEAGAKVAVITAPGWLMRYRFCSLAYGLVSETQRGTVFRSTGVAKSFPLFVIPGTAGAKPQGAAMANSISDYWRKVAKVSFAGLWVVGFLYALTSNPSADESKRRLKAMQSEIDVLVPKGSSVLYSHDLGKSGGAMLLRGLSAAAWTPDFESKYFSALSKLGWHRVDPAGIYCKDDMSITTYKHIVDYYGQRAEVVDISMDYSALSKRRCT